MSSGIVGDIDVFCASEPLAGAEAFMMDRTCRRKRFFLFARSMADGTTECFSGPLLFGTETGGLHFKSGIAEGAVMRSHVFRRLLVAWVERDVWLAFHCFLDESVEFPLVVS